MRAILASGGYSGWGLKISLADSTCPPTRMRLGVAALGGGGGGGALLPMMPPSTPPAVPPGTPPGTPPTTPTATWGGGSGSSLTCRIVFGMTVGAFMMSSAVTRCTETFGGAAAGGGGGGGGGGGAVRETIKLDFGKPSTTSSGYKIRQPTRMISKM